MPILSYIYIEHFAVEFETCVMQLQFEQVNCRIKADNYQYG